MKKVLFFLLGLVCDTYACVQFNELDAGGGWKNAILLCVTLIAAGYLFSKMTDKNTVPRYLVQGLHFAFCLCMLLCIYTETFPVYHPGEILSDILYSRSLSSLTVLPVGALILLLAVLYISSRILEEVRPHAGQIVPATAALLLTALTAESCYRFGFYYGTFDGSLYTAVCFLIPLVLMRWIASHLYRTGSLSSGIAQGITGLIHLCAALVLFPDTFETVTYVVRRGLIEDTFLPALFLLIVLLSALWMGISGIRDAFRIFKALAATRKRSAKPKSQPKPRRTSPRAKNAAKHTAKTAAATAKTAYDPAATAAETVPERNVFRGFEERLEDEKEDAR